LHQRRQFHNPYADSISKIELDGVRQQVFIAAPTDYGPEQIERSGAGHEKLVTARGEERAIGSYPALLLLAIVRV
jgi:hypothetical protein